MYRTRRGHNKKCARKIILRIQPLVVIEKHSEPDFLNCYFSVYPCVQVQYTGNVDQSFYSTHSTRSDPKFITYGSTDNY